VSASESKPLQVTPLARKVIEAVRFKYPMRLEKSVERISGAETQKPAKLRLAQLPTPVFFEYEGFEREPWQIFARGLEPLRHIVGNVEGDLHGNDPNGELV
jgi:hypothetical protein